MPLLLSMRNLLSRHLANARGWRTDRRIVVVESDDWGSVRTPSAKRLGGQLPGRSEHFCEGKRKTYEAYIEPYTYRCLHFLKNRGLFPRLLTRSQRQLLLNLVRCEAHRDVLLRILQDEAGP